MATYQNLNYSNTFVVDMTNLVIKINIILFFEETNKKKIMNYVATIIWINNSKFLNYSSDVFALVQPKIIFIIHILDVTTYLFNRNPLLLVQSLFLSL